MTDESDLAGVDPSGAETADSALEDRLADTLGIDAAADEHDAGDLSLPVADSEPSAARQRAPRAEADLSRFDAVSAGQIPPERPPRDGEPVVADTRRGRRKARKAAKANRKAPWWEMPALIVLAVLIAVGLKSYVVQPFYIPSASMENTLYGNTSGGDRILVNKVVFDLRDPHPGDIVVFHAPPGWDDEIPPVPPKNPVLKAIRGFGQLIGFVPPDGLVLVKRVIAVGGQTVKGTADGKVMVSDNGPGGPYRTLDESTYVHEDGVDSHAAFGPVTVPKGRLWVMGDHRNDSADSRFHCGLGGTEGPDGVECNPMTSTVPVDNVIGKAVVIAWPPSRWRTLGTPKTFTKSGGALGAALPVAAGLLIAPIYLVRRRRRNR